MSTGKLRALTWWGICGTMDLGTLWNSMEHYGTLWNIMEQCKTIELYATQWNIMLHFATQWNPMVHYGWVITMNLGTNSGSMKTEPLPQHHSNLISIAVNRKNKQTTCEKQTDLSQAKLATGFLIAVMKKTQMQHPKFQNIPVSTFSR